MFSGGGGQALLPHNVSKFLSAVAAQMGRSGDTMICGLACTRVLVSIVRDSPRYHVAGLQVVRGQYQIGLRLSGRFGDTYRLGQCVPGGWVGHFALMKCYTCLRGASGVRC